MKLLKQYFDIQKQIYDYFGFEEVWRVLPLEDATEYFWCLTSDGVRYTDTEALLKDPNGNYCESVLYQHCHMSTSVFRKDDYTMIAVDTQTDGNVFLMIFDNAKERREMECGE